MASPSARTKTGGGTIRVSVVPDPSEAVVEGSDPLPLDAHTVSPVTVASATGTQTIYLRGVGASPNAPLPRARRFVAVLAASFMILSALELLFFSTLMFLACRSYLVGYAGSRIVLALGVAGGGYAVTSVTQLVPDYIFPMYLAAMAAFAIAGGLVYRRPSLPINRRARALGVILLYVGVEVVLDAVFFTVPGRDVPQPRDRGPHPDGRALPFRPGLLHPILTRPAKGSGEVSARYDGARPVLRDRGRRDLPGGDRAGPRGPHPGERLDPPPVHAVVAPFRW